jgi:hypothetical protein
LHRFFCHTVGIYISINGLFKTEILVALAAKVGSYWNVKAFATLAASAPNASLPVVYVGLGQFHMASWTDQPVCFSKMLFSVNVSTVNVFDQGTLAYIERTAIWAAIADGDVG